MTAALLADLFWPVSRALGWIAFGDEARIEDSLRAATWCPAQAAWPLRDADPRGTLLRALQDGSLRALSDGKELPRAAWANATGRSWPDNVRFVARTCWRYGLSSANGSCQKRAKVTPMRNRVPA
jgi:hypothetical protein